MSSSGDTKEPARFPWLKFYPSDWQGDELLSVCSLGARGLLMEFVCLMHRALPYGHLLVNGKRPTDADLARVVRAKSVGELARLRDELLTRGVLSQTDDGAIFSRRMIREAERSAIGRETGRRGGNPQLKQKPSTDTVNAPPLTKPLTVGVNLQRPEAIFQRSEARKQEPGNVKSKPARWKWSSLNVTEGRHKVVTDALAAKASLVNFDKVYEAAATDYAEHGEPADLLGDLKKRAKAAIPVFDPIPSVEESAARQARMEAERKPLTPEEKARVKAMFREGTEKARAVVERKRNADDAAHRLSRYGHLIGDDERLKLKAIVAEEASRKAAAQNASSVGVEAGRQ